MLGFVGLMVNAETFDESVRIKKKNGFLVVSHDSIKGCVRPSVGRSVGRSVGWSVTSFFRRAGTSRRTTFFVYTNLFFLNFEKTK